MTHPEPARRRTTVMSIRAGAPNSTGDAAPNEPAEEGRGSGATVRSDGRSARHRHRRVDLRHRRVAGRVGRLVQPVAPERLTDRFAGQHLHRADAGVAQGLGHPDIRRERQDGAAGRHGHFRTARCHRDRADHPLEPSLGGRRFGGAPGGHRSCDPHPVRRRRARPAAARRRRCGRHLVPGHRGPRRDRPTGEGHPTRRGQRRHGRRTRPRRRHLPRPRTPTAYPRSGARSS